MVSDKIIHRAFIPHTTVFKQNPLENIFIFTSKARLNKLDSQLTAAPAGKMGKANYPT